MSQENQNQLNQIAADRAACAAYFCMTDAQKDVENQISRAGRNLAEEKYAKKMAVLKAEWAAKAVLAKNRQDLKDAAAARKAAKFAKTPEGMLAAAAAAAKNERNAFFAAQRAAAKIAAV